jgi:hypothetical protein
MADRLSNDDNRKRQSGLLDAIFDVVESDATRVHDEAESMFRAKAMDQIDVPAQVDHLLPLTSRRTWVGVASAAIVIVAGIIYAASTESISEVTADGRAVAPPGLAIATASVAGTITSSAVHDGNRVSANQVVARGTTSTGSPIEVRSPITGVVWQVLAPEGGSVTAGEAVVTVLPPGSRSSILVALPEPAATEVKFGQEVRLSGSEGSALLGTVDHVAGAPLPSATAAQLVGVPKTEAGLSVVVSIHPEEAVEPGALFSARIVVSKKSLLEQFLELR